MALKPISVCNYCFSEMQAISHYDTTIVRNQTRYCKKCNGLWRPTTVVLDPKGHEYVRIRMKTHNSILAACETHETCSDANCLYAHSQVELDVWGKSLQRDTTTESHATSLPRNSNNTISPPHVQSPYETQQPKYVPRMLPNMSGRGRPPRAVGNTHNRVISPPQTTDEAELYYNSVLNRLDDSETLPHSILIQPISNQPLEVKIEINKSPRIIEWSFLVTTSSVDIEVLVGVILETKFGTNFRLWSSLYKDRYTMDYVAVDSAPERKSTVLRLKKAVNNDCTLQILVKFKVQLGDFQARLIFDFSRLQLVKRLNIVVHRECHDTQAPQNVQARFHKLSQKSTQRESLLWDKDYEVRYAQSRYLDKLCTNREVYTSKIPINIDQIIKSEKYDAVLKEELTYRNYKRFFEMLLYLEEFECRSIFLSYDLKDQQINSRVVCDKYEKYDRGRGGTEFAEKGFCFIKFEMCGSLFEGFHFLRSPNVALIKPKAPQNYVYYCPSVEIGHDYIWIALSDELVAECELYGGTADIRFKESSIDFHFSMMHQALQLIDPRALFPCTRAKTAALRIQYAHSCIWEKSNLTKSQQHAIVSALNDSYQDVPTIISGPFGCGKSWTLCHLAYLLATQPVPVRVLICCKNNYPADKYIEDIHTLSLQHGVKLDTGNSAGITMLYRFYPPTRRLQDELIRRYTTLTADDYGSVPEEKDLFFCRIIVTTLFTCPFLVRMSLPKEFFTHIILDEAAQSSEPELGIAISLAGHFTKIVIAGDEYQVTPKLTSPISRKFGLELSLLERLSNIPIYQQHSLILLKENYRSDPVIVQLLSTLYYDQTLVSMRQKQPVSHNGLKPLAFRGVIGKEHKINDYPSYMNPLEAEETVHIVKELIGTFDPKEICIMSIYSGQVLLIRDYLRRERLHKVGVLPFEGLQGKEYRVLVINTVRTLSVSEYKHADLNSIGLLEEPKLLNTILGRAKDHILVVGNPYTLCEVGKNKSAWQWFLSECINLGSFYLGDKQTFQFDSIPTDIRIPQRNEPDTAVLATQVNGEVIMNETQSNSLKSRAIQLIERREESMRELHSLWEKAVKTNPHLQEYFTKECELIATQNSLIELEKGLAGELRDLDLGNKPSSSNW